MKKDKVVPVCPSVRMLHLRNTKINLEKARYWTLFLPFLCTVIPHTVPFMTKLILFPHFLSGFLNIFFFCEECLPILRAPYCYSTIYKRTQLIAVLYTSISWKHYATCAVQNVLLTSIFLGTNIFLIRATTFHVYMEHPLWCNALMYVDTYSAYRN
jgi:hypothetical protein